MKSEEIIAQINDYLYVGNVEAAKSSQILQKYNIHTVIDISGESIPKHVHTLSFMLPSQELMPTEQQKTIVKLEKIAEEIRAVVNNKQRVLINCFDGKNKCLLAAGYFLITEGGSPTDIVPRLETLYFSDKQKQQEKEDQMRLAARNPALDAIQMTQDEFALINKQREERKPLRGLTMVSFSKLLRATKPRNG